MSETKQLPPDVSAVDLCGRCGRNAERDPHACPYAEEMSDDLSLPYGDRDPEHCTCCDECCDICAGDL